MYMLSTTILSFHSGFDTHSMVEERLNSLFAGINVAFDAFSRELKAMDLWNNVTLIQTSDFARTLNPNSGDGTDHAWGGNYMMMGKSVSLNDAPFCRNNCSLCLHMFCFSIRRWVSKRWTDTW